MLGQDIDAVGWPQCGEIDVMENFGDDPSTVHGTVHGPGFAGHSGISAMHHAGTVLADAFHVYSVAWEPGRIRWYFDDRLYATVTPADLRGNPWVFDHDFYLLLNVAVGGTHSESPDGSVTFPQTMLIDYVRVYSVEAASADPLVPSPG
jgi:beta-glucanase (GH16 family)